MPESMYDKLGELLSEALDSGVFFDQSPPSSGKEPSASEQKPSPVQPPFNKPSLINAPAQVQKAAGFLGITKDMTFEEAKKQYRKKLLRFHPDKNADTQVIKKITEEKTEQILKNWAILEAWFSCKN